jgi:spore maturation protein CgeB
MRYTETLSCGGFLLADRPDDLDMVGLKDGVHLVIYKDLNDLVDKAKYYMSHNKERKRIEKRGMDFVRKNHSCKLRVKQMTKMIKEELGI